MKRIMMALLSLALTTSVLAQDGQFNRAFGRRIHHNSLGETYYGLRLGVGFARVSSDDSRLDGGTMKAGLDIGAVIGFQLVDSSPVYLESGLYYIEKGGKGRRDGDRITFNLDYLELPIVVKYSIDAGYKFSVQPFLGGYLALGVGGKTKIPARREAYSSFDDDGFGRFDGGIRLGCGAQYDIVYAELGYDIGLANISHDDFDSSHTGTLFLTVGVNF